MNFINAWIGWLAARRYRALALWLLFTAVFGFGLGRVKLDQAVTALFPAGHPYMQLNERYKEMLAQPDRLIAILAVKGGDIYTPSTLDRLQKLTRAVLELPGCDAADIRSITETSVKHMAVSAWGVENNPVMDHGIPQDDAEMARLRRRIETDPSINGVFAAYDGSAAAVMARWKKGDKLGRLHDDLVALAKSLSDDRHQVLFAGAPALGAHVVHRLGQLKTAGLAAVALLLIVSLLALRSLQGVLIPLLALVTTAICGAGLCGWTASAIHFLTIVPLLFIAAMACALSAVWVREYRRHLFQGNDRQEALKWAAARILPPTAAGVLVLVAAGVAMAAAPVPLLAELGRAAICWAAGAGGAVLWTAPLALALIPCTLRPAPEDSPAGLRPGGTAALILALALALAVAGAWNAARLPAGDNEPGKALFYRSSPYNRAFALFNDRFIGGYNMTVVAEGRQPGALKDLGVMELIGRFQDTLASDTDARACISVAMMMKLIGRIYHEGNPKWAQIPADDQERLTRGGAIKMSGNAGQWLDETWSRGSIQAMYGSDDDAAMQKRLERAQAFIAANPSEKVEFLAATGFMGTIAAMNQAGLKAYWSALWTALAASLLVALIWTRAPFLTARLALGLAAAQGGVWLLMGATGQSISIGDAAAAPLAVAFGTAVFLAFAGRRPATFSSLALGAVVGASLLIPWVPVELRMFSEPARWLLCAGLLLVAGAGLLGSSTPAAEGDCSIPQDMDRQDL